MRKTSRLWWLHGAILLSAVMGCKNCGGGNCGGAPPSGTAYGNSSMSSGPMMSASPTMYNGSPAMGNMGSSQPFSASGAGSYAGPAMSSSPMSPNYGR